MAYFNDNFCLDVRCFGSVTGSSYSKVLFTSDVNTRTDLVLGR